MAHPSDIEQLIAKSLDEYNVEDFIDPDFNGIAAHRIVSDLEFNNYKIIKLVPKQKLKDAALAK